MDREQVTRYFERLYEPGQHFELVAVKDGQARRATFEWPVGSDAVLTALEQFEILGYNLYASVLPIEVQEIGDYDRIWIDRDNPLGPWPFAADESWEHNQWPDPTVLVKTSEGESGGFRWQAIWRLEKPLAEKDARRVIKAMAKKGEGDPSVHDPRRVLRIPGLMNAKRGSYARLMNSASGTFDLEAFDLQSEAQEAGVTLDSLMNMELVRPHEVLGEWLNGVEAGDRARKAYVCARFLKSCGVTLEDAASIVVTGARRAEPPLSDQEVMHSVRSAYYKD